MPRQYNIDEIMQFVLNAAHSAKESAGYGGRWDDGGASVLENQVKFYRLGQSGKVPEEWKQYIPKPTAEEIRSDNHPLQFEYCECGCKCHSGSSKGIGYSIDNVLQGKLPFTVRRGHGRHGVQVGPKYGTFWEAVRAAQADWDKIP